MNYHMLAMEEVSFSFNPEKESRAFWNVQLTKIFLCYYLVSHGPEPSYTIYGISHRWVETKVIDHIENF